MPQVKPSYKKNLTCLTGTIRTDVAFELKKIQT